MRDVLNVIVGKYDFESEDIVKETMETKNITVEFSESFLGFTLLSTENAEHPAIISKFQRFEDGSMGPAESCGLLGVGDALVSIDGNSVVGMEYDEVVSELRKAGRPVRIEWSRKFYRPTKLVSLSTIKKVRGYSLISLSLSLSNSTTSLKEQTRNKKTGTSSERDENTSKEQ